MPQAWIEGAVRLRVSRVVPVPRAAAFTWWAEMRSGSHDHGFAWGSPQRNVTRDGATLVIVDTARLGPLRFQERLRVSFDAPLAVCFDGENSLAAHVSGAYEFEDLGQATRITCDTHIILRPALRWLAWLARPLARAFVAWDLRAHARELAAELAPVKGTAGATAPRP